MGVGFDALGSKSYGVCGKAHVRAHDREAFLIAYVQLHQHPCVCARIYVLAYT